MANLSKQSKSQIMNILAPVKTIMSSKLLTVNPKDKLMVVKEIFETKPYQLITFNLL